MVVSGLQDDPIEDVAESIRDKGGEAVAFGGDISEAGVAKECVDFAINKFKRLDVLINNAGVFLDNAMTEDYPIEDFDQTIRMNIRSAFLMTRFAQPHLQRTRGNIVSAGSESGMIGLAQNTTYGGTKGWMHAFMRGVAVEQAQNGVRANCVARGRSTRLGPTRRPVPWTSRWRPRSFRRRRWRGVERPRRWRMFTHSWRPMKRAM